MPAEKRDPIWCEQIIHPSKIRNNEPNPFNNSSLIEATFAPNIYQTYIINLRRPVTSDAHRLQFSVHTVASCFGTHPASCFPAVPDLKSDLLYWCNFFHLWLKTESRPLWVTVRRSCHSYDWWCENTWSLDKSTLDTFLRFTHMKSGKFVAVSCLRSSAFFSSWGHQRSE